MHIKFDDFVEYEKNNVMKEYIAQSLWGINSAGWSLAEDKQAFGRVIE
jgi:hypothetical protein